MLLVLLPAVLVLSSAAETISDRWIDASVLNEMTRIVKESKKGRSSKTMRPEFKPNAVASIWGNDAVDSLDPGQQGSFSARCRSDNPSTPTYTARLVVQIKPSATHLHTASVPQAIISSPTQEGAVNEPVYFKVKFPNITATVLIWAEFSGACNGQSDVTAQYAMAIPDLTLQLEAPPDGDDSAGYVLKPFATKHAPGFYGQKDAVEKFKKLASEYKDAFKSAPPLEVKGMSLKWGGMYDIDATWMEPFVEHDRGWRVAIAALPDGNFAWLSDRIQSDDYKGCVLPGWPWRSYFDVSFRPDCAPHGTTRAYRPEQ
jgi:hypothetical protein